MRITRQLLDNWQFRLSESEGADWSEVVLPHTYNARDAIGRNRYYRGPAVYRRALRVGNFSHGRRYFLRIEGACLIAEVRIDGRILRQHRGGFTEFYVEIDPSIFQGRESALLEIEVNNAYFDDVAPLAGDFNLFGGLHRPVHLIETSALCFTPTEHGGDGIRMIDAKPADARALVIWEASVSGPANGEREIRVGIRNAEGRMVAQSSHSLDGEDAGLLEIRGNTAIDAPILWQGIKQPYLYEVIWELIEGGEVMDRISKRIGIRSITRNAAGRLLLNGREIILRGACKHAEVGLKCSAVSHADIEADLNLLIELGANAVRLAHYPHSQYTLDLCDRLGLLAWCEIPLVDKIHQSDAFRATTLGQLSEMIEQNRHHASVFAWGLFNELYAGGSREWNELVVELHKEAKRLDSTRFTVCASHRGTPEGLKDVTDLLAANLYCGWYLEKPEDMKVRVAEANASGGGRGLCVSEYGAGANLWHHEEPPASKVIAAGYWHPEEWQSHVHERQYEAIRQSDFVWGSFVWVLADFFSSARNEGGIPGINDKGLVSLDRTIRKDAFYFYKAHWSDQPVLWIHSKRNYRPNPAPEAIKGLFQRHRSLGGS